MSEGELERRVIWLPPEEWHGSEWARKTMYIDIGWNRAIDELNRRKDGEE